jgi:uncharacterized membrane protein YfcA
MFLGAVIRVKYLPDPSAFRLFAGCVLLYLAARMGLGLVRKRERAAGDTGEERRRELKAQSVTLRQLTYEFEGIPYGAPTLGVAALGFVVGIVGGIYGIGGGAMVAPYLVVAFGLAVHSIAGATLLATWVSSIAGVIFYTICAYLFGETGLAIAPDWGLGALLGIGGAAGMYAGARLQRFMPQAFVQTVLLLCVLFVAVAYLRAGVRSLW